MITPETAKVLIVGATPNPSRYAYLAAEMLLEYHFEIFLFGIKKGEVFDKTILNDWAAVPEDIHTVTLYVGPSHQESLIQPILDLKPRRIIFNPGTENPDFMRMAEQKGIEVAEACTLVLLKTGQF